MVLRFLEPGLCDQESAFELLSRLGIDREERLRVAPGLGRLALLESERSFQQHPLALKVPIRPAGPFVELGGAGESRIREVEPAEAHVHPGDRQQ